MKRLIFIFFLGLKYMVGSFALAQQYEADTLYYFNPNSLELNPVFTGDVENAGVYFTPDSSWSAYDILQIHLLFNPIADTISGLVSLNKGDTIQQPGDTLLSIPFQAIGAAESYPNWKVIDLSGMSEAANMHGNFWLVSLRLLSCAGSSTVSQHSLVYSTNTSSWGYTTWDFATRVVLRKRTITRVDYRPSSNLRLNQIEIQNYPNPFNTSTIIHLQTQAEKEYYAINILNIKAQIIRTLFAGTLVAGEHRFKWNGKDSNFLPVPTGLYFIQIATGRQAIYTKKLLLVR